MPYTLERGPGLFRIALHTCVVGVERVAPRACFGRVETYGGLFYDDRLGEFRFGLRTGGETAVDASMLLNSLALAHVTVAPEATSEDLV